VDSDVIYRHEILSVHDYWSSIVSDHRKNREAVISHGFQSAHETTPTLLNLMQTCSPLESLLRTDLKENNVPLNFYMS
jgi:hypothetical protein